MLADIMKVTVTAYQCVTIMKHAHHIRAECVTHKTTIVLLLYASGLFWLLQSIYKSVVALQKLFVFES
jgi:hypothetical protein